MIKAVLFDFYDTLARIEAGVAASRRRLADLYGVAATDFDAAWRTTLHERSVGALGALEHELAHLARALQVDLSTDTLHHAAQGERQAWINSVRIYTDTRPTLATLRHRGLQLGLVSNCTTQTRGVLHAHDLESAFDAIALSCEVGVAKPDPQIYIHTCRQLGVPPEQCVFVADGAGGELDAARTLGMIAVLIEHDDQHRAAIRSQGHDVRIESLSELLTLEVLHPS